MMIPAMIVLSVIAYLALAVLVGKRLAAINTRSGAAHDRKAHDDHR